MAIVNGVHNAIEVKQVSHTTPDLPSYPTNSLDFLHSTQENGNLDVAQSHISLKIIIVGAGLGGLATACALARRGHYVTVFEQANQLSEVRLRHYFSR